jgi:hypothetical protein
MAKFGCPLVSDEEITVAAEAMGRASNHLLGGQGTRNLAYHVLIALRSAHFDERAKILAVVDRLRK